MKKIVEMHGIHKYYPGVHALDDIDFDVEYGEILGLVGENGAGKSTLNKVLSGVENFEEGTYLFEGKSVKFSTPKEAIDAGICVIHQELTLCDSISVAQNIYMGNYPVRTGGLVNARETNQRARKLLDEVGLAHVLPTFKAESLSAAEKQLVEVARALSRNCKLLIMDEPTSALAPKETEMLHSIMRKLKERGVSIIYISHKLGEIFDICDRVTIMRDGRKIATSHIQQIDRESMIAMMVGRKVSEMFNRTPSNVGNVVLEVEHLSNAKVHDVSFYVRSGEIVCFSGLMGAGRTETVKAVFGFDRRTTGTVRVDGREVPPNSTDAANKCGIGFISEDRKLEGIFPFFSVKDNMALVNLKSVSVCSFFVSARKERDLVTSGIRQFNVKTTGPDQIMATLSGGNQQKVLLARWLLNKQLKVLIVDEPTRGIDVGAKSEIYALLNMLANAGLAIVVVSSEMQEIINVCDRVYVMKEGRITGEVARADATQTKLMEYAIL